MEDAGAGTECDVPHALAEIEKTLPHIVWTARSDGTIDWVNAELERYTGQSMVRETTDDWLLCLHPSDRQTTLSAWRSAIAAETAFHTEFRLWCAELDRWRLHLADARPQRDATGGIIRWFGTAIDIQDRRDAAEARETELWLQRVERSVLEQTASGATLDAILHDLCNAIADVIPGALVAIGFVSKDGAHLNPYLGHPELADWARDLGRRPVGEGHGSCPAAIARGKPVFSSDIARDPMWSPYHDIAARHGLAAGWALPIFSAAGPPVACLACFHRVPRAPSRAQVTLLQRMTWTARNAIVEVNSRDRLQASEQRYRSLFDFLPIAVWEKDISSIQRRLRTLRSGGIRNLGAWLEDNPDFLDTELPEMHVIAANRAARHLHGCADAGADALERAQLALAADPTYRGSMRRMLLALWDGDTHFDTSYPVRRPDASRADVLVRMLLPARDNGRLLVTELDVTDQRRTEERFRHVAQASSDYIFDRDFCTDMTWVNEAAVWSPDHPPGAGEVPRKAWIASIHPEERENLLKYVDTVVAGGADFWEAEYRMRQPGGDYIPVLERASILRDQKGTPLRMIGNIINLSRQKELEAQARQSQRLDAIGQMTGGIAHDFNNLLTVILGNSETLIDCLPGNDLSATLARQIFEASQRAADLTQRLLAFARKQPLLPETVDANRIILDMRRLIERAITPGVRLELALAPDLCAIHVDRAMFESAVLNLCVNARDAMPGGGSLRITTSAVTLDETSTRDALAPGDYVSISVSDTGEGMDSDTLNRVFEPFFTTKRPGQGSGLGLSMVYGFVLQSGGRVHVRSAPGAGTTVELLLPRRGQSPAHVGRDGPAEEPL